MSKATELEELKASLGELVGEADNLERFLDYVECSGSPCALERKTKELICLAAGITARCEHCVLWHVDGALEAGATRDEIIETLELAVVMGGGPAMTYAVEAYETMEALQAPEPEPAD